MLRSCGAFSFSRLRIAASTVFLSIQHSSAISRRDGKQTPFLSCVLQGYSRRRNLTALIGSHLCGLK